MPDSLAAQAHAQAAAFRERIAVLSRRITQDSR
jgi:hypothetical protein